MTMTLIAMLAILIIIIIIMIIIIIYICGYPLKILKSACFIKNSRFIVNREILVTALGIYGLVQNETNAEGSEWETTVDVEVYICIYIYNIPINK